MRDHAGELPGTDLAFEAGAPVQGEQGVEEQVALAGEDEDLAHQGGEADVVEFGHGAIEFEVPGQGSQLVAVDARDDGQEEVGAALGAELGEVLGHARDALGARQVAAAGRAVHARVGGAFGVEMVLSNWAIRRRINFHLPRLDWRRHRGGNAGSHGQSGTGWLRVRTDIRERPGPNTRRAGMGKKPLSLASMRTHITQVKALLRGDIADIDGGLAQILASDGWLPDRPINVPVYMAGQGPKARALAKEITDGLISLGGPAEGFETCLVSTNGTVLDDGEDVASPRASTALKPIIALAYHHRYTTDPEAVKALPNGEAWLASVERVGENVRHLSVHRGHNLDVSNGHDPLVDVSAAKQMTFTGTREELRKRLTQLEVRGATGIIFETSGYDVERELRAYAEIAGLRRGACR